MTAPDDAAVKDSGIDLTNFTVILALSAVLSEDPNGARVLFKRLPEHAARPPKIRQRNRILAILTSSRHAARLRPNHDNSDLPSCLIPG
jgi:hypothetical protein